MKNNKDYFWIPFCFTLIGALITGGFNETVQSFSNADWANEGQSIFTRWLDEQRWFLEGSLSGAIVGLIVGVIVYFFVIRKKDKYK